jgi:hypothetical protein
MRPLRVESPLGLFSVLWALSAALHDLEDSPLAGLPLYPFVVLLLLYPDRVWAIATFALAHAALLVMKLPAAANHSVVALLVDLCLLIGCIHALGGGPAASRGRRLWAAVRGPIQATVAAVYGFALLHKLNSSFFDPDVSCAVSQLAKLFRVHGLHDWPTDPSILGFNIHFTLLAEAAILVLLLWPRFTHIGALVGLLFHIGVAWARFFDFATVVFALYLFFLPWEGIERNMRRIPRWAGSCFVACLVALAAISFYFHGIRGDPVIFDGPRWSLEADTLICVAWTLMILPILLPIFSRREATPGDRRWTGAPLAWLIPAIALLNGATSYLGLKTVANYSMFSNLRTEGGRTNHFLIPPGRFFIADYQNDLARVAVVERVRPDRWPWWVRLTGRHNARWRAEVPGARVPFMEVRRILQAWNVIGVEAASIVYERRGRWRDVADAFADPELMQPLSFWERRLLAFRAVQEDGEESICRW